MPPAAGIAVLGLALILAGGMFDAEPLYPAGLAFVVLAVAMPLWVRLAARGAGVTRWVGARRVLEDEPLEVALDIRVGRGVPCPGGAVHEPLVRDELPLPPLGYVPGAGGRGRLRLSVRFARRGRRALPPPALVLRDPLGVATRRVGGRVGPADRLGRATGLPRLPGGGPALDEVLVLPRLHPVTAPGEGGESRLGRSPALAVAAAVEVDGLRPYREGAPASRIHWPAVARGAGLIERRLRAEADARPLVVLDARAPAREEDLDAAVRAAASLAHALARDGGCALLLPGDRRPTLLDADLSGWAAAHARLALVAAGGPPPAPAAAGPARRGPVLYVAARPVERLPAALAAAARGPRLLVVPGALPGRTAAFSVAGCTGYALRATRPAAAREAVA